MRPGGTRRRESLDSLRRWLVFNLVGGLGIVVQLVVLFCLIRAGLDYVPATALAVECAVLNNFLWHEAWTWRDRTRAIAEGAGLRLLRFNLTVGAVSIAGNLFLMRLLVGQLGLPAVAGNAIVIAAFGLLNFLVSDRFVFGRSSPMRGRGERGDGDMSALDVLKLRVLCVGALFALIHANPAMALPRGGGELPAPLLSAWDEYRQLTEARIDGELASGAGFLAQDLQSATDADENRAAVLSGQLVVEPIETLRPDGSDIDVPGGMVHHWRGAILIPGVTLHDVLHDVLYPDDAGIAQEDVLESRVLARDDHSLRVYLKLVRKKVVTATYNTEHEIEYARLGEGRAVSRTVATRIRELEDAGTPREREKPPDEDRGFLWRLNSYWRYEAVEGGVVVECESITLSRSIPFFLGPLVRPIVTGVAKESLDRTLSAMRDRIATAAGGE